MLLNGTPYEPDKQIEVIDHAHWHISLVILDDTFDKFTGGYFSAVFFGYVRSWIFMVIFN